MDRECLIGLGASHVIDTSTAPLFASVMEVTNWRGADAVVDSIGGPDGVVDSIGGPDGEALAFCGKAGGWYLSLGLLSGVPVDWGRIVEEANVRASLFHLRHWNKNVSAERWQAIFSQLIRLVCEERLRVMPARTTYPLVDVKKAVVAADESGMRKGKGKVMLVGG